MCLGTLEPTAVFILFCLFVPTLIWHEQMVPDIARGKLRGIISPKASRKALTLFEVAYFVKHDRRGYIKYII